MLLAILGDVHGAFDAADRAMALEPAAAAWLSVGDIASDSGAYRAFSRPLFFIKGNNEDFDLVARLEAGEEPIPGLRVIRNGTAAELPLSGTDAPHAPVGRAPHAAAGPAAHEAAGQASGLSKVRVAGLGGTFAPKWYETLARDLPAGGGKRSAVDFARRDDKRRHFVRADVEACKALRDVDIFLSHEAPRPYWVGSGARRNDAGKAVVNEVIASMRPRLHVFGHHHRFSQRVCEGVPSIGLPLVVDGFLLLDTDSWTWRMRSLDELESEGRSTTNGD